MIKELLRHHARRAREITNAIENCHVTGLHSVMLHDDGPGNRIRLFFAERNHELYRNAPCSKFSLGIHSHHCHLTLFRVFGTVHNLLFNDPEPGDSLDKCIFSGGVDGNPAQLTKTGERVDMRLLSMRLIDDGGTTMTAWQHHTVFVPKLQRAAWIVLEGEEYAEHKPSCYTNNWDGFDASNLYVRTTETASYVLSKVVQEIG